MASKATLENKLRTKFLSFVSDTISQEMETDVLPVSASELAIPCLDEEGNEKFVLIKISIPRGTRNGVGGYDPYDGYAANEAYLDEIASKAQERAVKRAMKDAEKGKNKKEEKGDNYADEYAPHELANMLN
jgi:hypothetical protein